jgi:hypothetical protein
MVVHHDRERERSYWNRETNMKKDIVTTDVVFLFVDKLLE